MTEAAIVAGVGPGLGSALGRAWAREGYPVALFSRRVESSEPTAAQIQSEGGKALVLPVDVTDRKALFAAVDKVRGTFGPITVVAYNVGGYGRSNFLALDPESIRQSFEVGTMGAVHLCQATIPDMLRAGHGAISFTGATASLRGRAGFAPLAIGKSSLRILSQSLAREFHPKGIHIVHVVVDGQIDSPRRREGKGEETTISPDAIASTIINIFKQPKNGWTHEIDIRPYTESF